MDLGISDKTALVLAGGGGLGGAIARQLAEEGARVAIADINRDAAQSVADAFDPHGSKSFVLAWDLADLDVLEARIGSVEQALGPIDILVNITGGPPPGPILSVPHDSWTAHFQTMVLPVIAVSQRVVRGMKDRQWGRILTSTSSGVVSPIANLGISNSLRSALVGWSKTIARELGPFNVTANVLVPGRIGTQRIRELDAAKAAAEDRTPDAVAQDSTAMIPMGRYGTVDEYAAMAAFLVSKHASYITGSMIRVDGGLIGST
ncbi:MAG: SDR family oxidoreductase [Nakamurella sp.]